MAVTYHYVCGCGWEFEEALGRFGCPNCEGECEAELEPDPADFATA